MGKRVDDFDAAMNGEDGDIDSSASSYKVAKINQFKIKKNKHHGANMKTTNTKRVRSYSYCNDGVIDNDTEHETEEDDDDTNEDEDIVIDIDEQEVEPLLAQHAQSQDNESSSANTTNTSTYSMATNRWYQYLKSVV